MSVFLFDGYLTALRRLPCSLLKMSNVSFDGYLTALLLYTRAGLI
jgi:hypothetical protein